MHAINDDQNTSIPSTWYNSRKYSYLLQGRSLANSKAGGGGGVSKAKICKRKYEKKKLEIFREGWGLKPKKSLCGGVWIFSGTAHATYEGSYSTKYIIMFLCFIQFCGNRFGFKSSKSVLFFVV